MRCPAGCSTSRRRAPFAWATGRTRFHFRISVRTPNPSAIRSIVCRSDRRDDRSGSAACRSASTTCASPRRTGSQRVLSGAVDLECGATTNTAQRRQQVAFSPVMFVTGNSPRRAGLAVGIRDAERPSRPGRRGGPRDHQRDGDARGRPPARPRCDLCRRRRLPRRAAHCLPMAKPTRLRLTKCCCAACSPKLGAARDFRLVGAMLSFEPYGIMYPRDDAALGDAVDRTLRTLAESREIVWLYDRWFVRPLPSRPASGPPDGRRSSGARWSSSGCRPTDIRPRRRQVSGSCTRVLL